MNILGKNHSGTTLLIGGLLGILFSELWWKFTGAEDPITQAVDNILQI